MADEPALPRFPRWDSGSQSFNARKRVRSGDDAAAAQLFANSSDPAMFSSDDDPNVENYTQGGPRHRKKRYVGSWFQQQPASGDSAFSEESCASQHHHNRLPRPPRGAAKRTFERTFDSGVWMGSDASTDLELEDSLPPPPASRLPQLDVNRGRQTMVISRAEELAREKIFDAVENGTEDVDLTSMNLETLSNATIAPLSGLECIPTVAEGVPFEQKDPSLKVYLSQNPLTKMPGALCNLQFLTYLTLRNTKVTEIPPAIGNLRNLQTLNISLNRLRYLPGELLDLLSYPSKLKSLMIHSNYFYSFHGDKFTTEKEESELENVEHIFSLDDRSMDDERSTMKLWLDRQDGFQDGREYPELAKHRNWTWRARIVARTPVQFEDSRGFITSKYHLPDHQTKSGAKLETEDLAQTPEPPLVGASRKSSRVPSLLELALKACSRTTQLPHLPSYLPEDAPAHLPELLRRIAAQAEANANMGDLPCSKCKRRVIVPVAHWIEWWHLYKLRFHTEAGMPTSVFDSNDAVPFMKRACSYTCLPEATEQGALLPGSVRYSIERSES
ncbi:hypothetical protein PFICI_02858 [Pestalotiopsis fici W106-1]|uniref:Uncharacterized protein n=1 Tax=Pestalotiopsis fici (strain W106-1 / CGMCC3.15140) TaxID=1229662 RepID=W3XFG0_PESFW|nr:uncharacterized protein PFICI_02858 [Pestalotiopsis fici W106-1]ETS84833.1 hypothetical protein PFICI_02858 [Pestalotiopsis fici W106-1]